MPIGLLLLLVLIALIAYLDRGVSDGDRDRVNNIDRTPKASHPIGIRQRADREHNSWRRT